MSERRNPRPADLRRPKLVLRQTATVDGRLALSPGVLLMADPRWPSGEGGGYTEVLRRHRPQVVLEGSGSLVLPDAGSLGPEIAAGLGEEDSAAADPSAHFLPDEVLARATGWFAVVDSRGRVEWQFTEFPDPAWEGIHLLVLVCEATPAHYLAYLRGKRIPYLVAGGGRVDLPAAMAALHDVLGVATVVATCGARLGGALLRANLVDELEIEVLPIAAGGEHAPVMLTSPDLAPAEPPVRLDLVEAAPLPDSRLLIRYAIIQPRPAGVGGA